MTKSIAVLLKGYPRLSETFIAQEILALQKAGFRLELISLRHPTDTSTHPVHDEIDAPVNYLPEYLHQEPLRVLRAVLSCVKRTGFGTAAGIFLKDLWRDRTRNRIRRFGQAMVMVHEMPEHVGWLYAHFIHTPSSVAYYAHFLCGRDWSCSAHAKDIWTSPEWELTEKLANMRWAVTCTANGHGYLAGLSPDPSKVTLLYHGIDLSRFPKPQATGTQRNGSAPEEPVRIVTVGRAVEKKGLDTLIDALAALPADLNWTWIHIGGGTLKKSLAVQVQRNGLSDRVQMLGARPQEFVLRTCRESDLFVLPSRIASDGDRDGLPNVLLEAQSQGLACISTPVSGIVELIEDGKNGCLVPPDDVGALATTLESLIRSPETREKLGLAGMDKVRNEFDHRMTTDALLKLFEESGLAPIQPRVESHAAQ